MGDEELMARFQSNREERAFSEIYRRYSQRLLYFMYRMLNHDEALAQDKLHDVFTRIIEKPERFDTTRNFKTWIFTVAANECRKHFRREPMDSLEDKNMELNFSPEEVIKNLDEKRFKRELQRELQQLSYAHRSTFIMRYQEHMSIKEISEIMQCSEGTVKSRSYYCLKTLAEKLSVYNPIES